MNSRIGPRRVQDAIDVQEIRTVLLPGHTQRWGLLTLPGERYRLLAGARGLVNLGLLSPEEQDQAEQAWQGALRAMDWPLELFVQSEPVGLPEVAPQPAEASGFEAYATAYREHLELWTRHTVQVRRIYLVIPSDERSEAIALRDLERRVKVLTNALNRWVGLSVLSPEEVRTVLASTWRKRTAPQVDPSTYGWDRLVVEGVSLADARSALTQPS